jgi:hypothetical protein
MRDARVHDDPPAVIAAGAAPRHGDRQGDGAEGYTVRRVRCRQDVDIPALRQQHVRRQQRSQVDPGPRQHRQGVRRRGQTNTSECQRYVYVCAHACVHVGQSLLSTKRERAFKKCITLEYSALSASLRFLFKNQQVGIT